MDTFCLSKDNITLKPLTYNDIDDRIIWNTTITDWKREENPMEDTANVFLFNEEKYRIKKKEEICSGGKTQNGLHTSLEIFVENVHVGFINCHAYPLESDILLGANIGIIIPNLVYRNKGYGTQCVELYSNYLFGKGVRRLYLITFDSNLGMLSVMRKNGFEVISKKGSKIISYEDCE